MTAAIQLLNQAVSEAPSNRREYRWDELLDAIEAIAAGESFGWEAERALLRVVRFEGELCLSEDSEPTHSMSPEEMLKSVAIQTLAKRTGLTHLLDMQRVEATAASPVLASIVRATIRAAAPPNLPATELGIVAEVRPSPRREVLIGPLGRGIGQNPARALPRGRPKITEEVIPDRYTKYNIRWRTVPKNIVRKAVILDHGLTFLPSHRGRKKRTEDQPAIA
jgi:hypothetical protein